MISVILAAEIDALKKHWRWPAQFVLICSFSCKVSFLCFPRVFQNKSLSFMKSRTTYLPAFTLSLRFLPLAVVAASLAGWEFLVHKKIIRISYHCLWLRRMAPVLLVVLWLDSPLGLVMSPFSGAVFGSWFTRLWFPVPLACFPTPLSPWHALLFEMCEEQCIN